MRYANKHRIRYVTALALVVTAFLAFSLPPYLTGGTRVPATFGLHYPLLVAHVLLASVAMVCAVMQILPGLRRRHRALHRRTGRVYVGAAIPAAVSAIVIGPRHRSGRYSPSAMSSWARCGCGSPSTGSSPRGDADSTRIGAR